MTAAAHGIESESSAQTRWPELDRPAILLARMAGRTRERIDALIAKADVLIREAQELQKELRAAMRDRARAEGRDRRESDTIGRSSGKDSPSD